MEYKVTLLLSGVSSSFRRDQYSLLQNYVDSLLEDEIGFKVEIFKKK